MAQFIPDDIMNSKNKHKFVAAVYPSATIPDQSRGSSVVERWTHNPEVEGATPSPATIPVELPSNIVLGYN